MAIKIGNFTPPSWLQMEPKIKILAIHFIENLQKAAINKWNITINKIRQQLWVHMSRYLNIIQKTIMCNTFVLSKLWFMSAIFSANNQMTARITSVGHVYLEWPPTTSWVPRVARIFNHQASNQRLCLLPAF
jgi:hypothetical protein